MNADSDPDKSQLVFSYYTLRRAMGFMGMALPVILMLLSWIVLPCHNLETSISNYYHTPLREVLVVILSSFGIFLFAYHPPGEKWKWDRLAAKLGGFFGLCVAFFPTDTKTTKGTMPIFCRQTGSGLPDDFYEISNYVHLSSAFLFFLVLALMSIFLFTRCEEKPTAQKIKRNRVYRICGITILFCLAGFIVYFFFREKLDPIRFLFIVEAIALWAFGISWLTKGEIWLRDSKPVTKTKA